MSYFGMGMIFTNSGQRGGKQMSAPMSAPISAPISAPRQSRAFPPVMSGGPVFRTMDLGSLKKSKSCGSCGH